ncbi:MAG: hypothetical protein LIO93_12860 [Bacteroidales bacterium]|nr:hypothetical protein [Bacteroidales bacterium]
MKYFQFTTYEENGGEYEEVIFPDFYYKWKKAFDEGRSPEFLDVEPLMDLLEIYYEDYDKVQLKKSIPYILNFHPGNTDLIEEVLFYLNELGEWIELYRLTEQLISSENTVYPKAYKISAMMHLGMEEEAFLYFQQLKREYENKPEDLSPIYQVLGNALNEIEHYEAALQVANEAISVLNSKMEFYWIQLSAYISLEEEKNALRTAEKIAKSAPLDKNIWFELGKAYIEMKRLDKAIEAFEFTITLGGDDINLFMNLMGLYEVNGNDLKSIDTAKRSMKIRPDYPEPFFMAVELCLKMDMLEEALGILDEGIEAGFERDREDLFWYKARIFVDQQEYKKAIAILEEGIKDTGDKNHKLVNEIKEIRKEFPYL